MAKRSSDFGKGYWSISSTGLIVTIVPADSDTAILLQNGDNRCGPHVVAVADFVLLKPIKLSNGTLLGLQNLGLAFSWMDSLALSACIMPSCSESPVLFLI